MEQPRCWMWTRRRQGLTSTTNYDESWEEQAFAEDTAGTLGGCVWPPRSYSCSFCRREFRSAQALGGHMNVHRRDRARLKQQSPCNSHLSSIEDNTFQNQTQIQSPLFDSSFHDQYQQKDHHHHHHKVCSFVDNYNPNPNSAHHQQNHQASCPEKNLLRTLSSSPSNSSPKSCSSSDLGKETDHHHDHIIKKRCRTEREDDDNLSVSLNLFVRRARPASPVEAADRVGCKRKRIENWALPSLLLKPIAVDRSPSSSNIDHGLDLELRLGGTYSLAN